MAQDLNLIKAIRAFEAEHGYKPATIKKLPNEAVLVTFDATVLYRTKEEDYSPENKGTMPFLKAAWDWLKAAWDWLNDRDTSFDCEAHKNLLCNTLLTGDRNGGVISVEKRHVKFPIPYFDIPLPFFRRAGTKVKNNTELATQPVKITLLFSNTHDANAELAIKNIIAAATASSSKPNHEPLPSAAKRISWNPVKWLLHGIAYLIPRSIAQHINKILPNAFIKASRPRDWGTGFSQAELSPPLVNSGLLATLASVPSAVAVSVLTRYDQKCNNPTIMDGVRANSKSSPSYLSQSKTTMFSTGKSAAQITEEIQAAVNVVTGSSPRP